MSAQELNQKIGWGISAFNIPKVWQYSQGEGIITAIIDSGCDINHQDLADNLLEGINVINPKEPMTDECKHGTHLTGILCASNNKIGIVGVAPKSKVIPIKVLDESGTGEMKDVSRGIRYAIERKVDFILMSLGCLEPVASVRKAIKEADKAGIICFVSAGNLGKSEHLLYPANYPETISIGAIDKHLKRADFNNTGKNLDFLAPGVDILSTEPNNWYGIMSGSSMAAPFVVGLASLAKARIKNKDLNIKLECADDYRKFFKSNTINIKDDKYAGNKFYQGFGIITPDQFDELV